MSLPASFLEILNGAFLPNSRRHRDTYTTILIAPCEHIKLYLSNDNFRRVKSITEYGCYPG